MSAIFASSGFAYNFYFRNRTEAAQLRNTIDHEIIKRESLTRELLKQKDEVLKYQTENAELKQGIAEAKSLLQRGLEEYERWLQKGHTHCCVCVRQ